MYYEANAAVVQGRWPEVWRLIASATSRDDVELVQGPGAATLCVGGLRLTSAYNRDAEAVTQAEAVPVESTAATVYGLALGDLPRALLARSGLERLTVVVLNPALARHSLTHFDHRDWLADPRVCLRDAVPQMLQRPFAVVPAELRFACDAALPLRDALLLDLAQPYVDTYWKERQRLLAQHIAGNAEAVAHDGDVAALFGSRPGARLGVVAAGPSLSQRLDWLSAHRGELTLIAVSSAVPPLFAAGLIPDVVVAIDAVSRSPFRSDQATHFREVPLVYAPEVDPEMVSAWPGPRRVAYLQQPRYVLLARCHPRGFLWTSGTVTHSAVDLALRMGAAEVILLGVDFAYPQAQSHAAHAAQHVGVDARLHRFSVLNGRGERVMSDPNFIAYLRDLESYVAAHPKVRFLNASRDGAAIKGVSYV